MLSDLLIRLRALFRRSAVESELDDELRFHFEQQVEKLVQSGLPLPEARRRARLVIGGSDQIKEECREARGTHFIETLLQDMRFALRMLRKSPGFTAVAVLTIALGIGANTAIFSVVNTVLLGHLPYKDPDRLAMIWGTNAQRGVRKTPVSPGDFVEWKQKNAAFQDIAASSDDEVTLTGAGAPQLLIGYDFAANYFSILGVSPELGRTFNSEEDRPGAPKVVVLSDKLWHHTFHADRQILGKSITLDGEPYSVIGVMPSDFDYPPGVQVWMPIALPASAASDYQRTYIRVMGRLKRGVSFARAEAQMTALARHVDAEHPATDAGNGITVTPLRRQLAGDIQTPLLVLLGAAGFVLLIACANVASLLLARATTRHKEIAIRAALGAGRGRLLRQFFTESLLLALVGGVLGIALAWSCTNFLVSIFPNDIANLSIPRVENIPINAPVLFFALAATIFTGLAFGVVPAMQSARAEAGDVLKESDRSATPSSRSARLRRVLVVAQIASSLVLLAGAGLLIESFERVAHANLGFQPDHVLGVEVFLASNRYPRNQPDKKRAFVRDVLQRMKSLPGVRSAGAVSTLPLTGFWGETNFLVEGQARPKLGETPDADNRFVTPGYFSTMRIPLLRGRSFTGVDRDGTLRVAIVDETLARRYLGGKDPVGKRLNLGTPEKPEWWQVVGEVGNVKAFGLERPGLPTLYRPFAQLPVGLIAFTIRTEGDPAALLKSAEQAVWDVDEDQPVFQALPMSALAAQSVALRRVSTLLLAGFAMLALALAAVGIYGVMAYSVAQRTHEIGVRMALGAQQDDVLKMVVGQGIKLILLGAGIGIVAALALTRLMAALLFGVTATDPATFLGVTILLVVVALLACYIPARRAMKVDPMSALRYE
ncbi:MAG: ADOP family duplicated permease [Candidatus Acidiferrales bacterium]